MNAALASAKANVATGTVLTGASANGASSTFEVTDGGVSPQDLFRMWSELIDLYEAEVAYLEGSPTDADIFAAMLTAIGKPVRRYHNRYASLHG